MPPSELVVTPRGYDFTPKTVLSVNDLRYPSGVRAWQYQGKAFLCSPCCSAPIEAQGIRARTELDSITVSHSQDTLRHERAAGDPNLPQPVMSGPNDSIQTAFMTLVALSSKPCLAFSLVISRMHVQQD